jgi:hypothetical protein
MVRHLLIRAIDVWLVEAGFGDARFKTTIIAVTPPKYLKARMCDPIQSGSDCAQSLPRR